MAKNTKKISSIIKSSVLSELNTESYSITQIAESHGKRPEKPVLLFATYISLRFQGSSSATFFAL